MSLLLDTSVVIPYLGNLAYGRLLFRPMVREQVIICVVSCAELLAGSLSSEQRRKSLAFIDRFDRDARVVTPTQGEWLRTGTILSRYQNRFGHVEPAKHQNDILILLAATRVGASVVTENGGHFRIWERFLPSNGRPPLWILDRQGHPNQE